MTLGERRKRDPRWHFQYALGQYSAADLQRIASSLRLREQTSVVPTWIERTYMEIVIELFRRRYGVG